MAKYNYRDKAYKMCQALNDYDEIAAESVVRFKPNFKFAMDEARFNDKIGIVGLPSSGDISDEMDVFIIGSRDEAQWVVYKAIITNTNIPIWRLRAWKGKQDRMYNFLKGHERWYEEPKPRSKAKRGRPKNAQPAMAI